MNIFRKRYKVGTLKCSIFVSIFLFQKIVLIYCRKFILHVFKQLFGKAEFIYVYQE